MFLLPDLSYFTWKNIIGAFAKLHKTDWLIRCNLHPVQLTLPSTIPGVSKKSQAQGLTWGMLYIGNTFVPVNIIGIWDLNVIRQKYRFSQNVTIY